MSLPPNDDGAPKLHPLSKALARIDLDGHDLPPSPVPSSPSNDRRRYQMATELVYMESTDQYNSSSIPIYQSATFKGLDGEFDYTRSGNPTRKYLENYLRKIMRGSTRAFAVSSGMSAIDTITRLLKQGDEVITGSDLYGGTNRLLKYISTHGGIIVHHVDTSNTEKVAALMSSKTAMLLLESPSNPLLNIVDVRAIATLAHNINPDCLVMLDNTMLSPLLQNPLELGCDIWMESATKYLGGHHDLMGGVLSVQRSDLADKLYHIINSIGCGLSPNDSWLLLRGMKTLKVRLEQQQKNAQIIAEFLAEVGFEVRYPGLKSHPQRELYDSMASGAGAVLSFVTNDVGISERIVQATTLFGISVSFGCVNSLISLPCRMSHASIDQATRKARGLPEDLIRLCIGIEEPEDLVHDLKTALVSAGAVTVQLDGIIKRTSG